MAHRTVRSRLGVAASQRASSQPTGTPGTVPIPTGPLSDLPPGTWATFVSLASDSGRAASDNAVRYEAVTMVLESGDHGSELCLSGALFSLPPQCGDVPVSNWDWDMIDGEQSAGGSTWVHAFVTGTYDGSSFIVNAVRAATEADAAKFAPAIVDTTAPAGVVDRCVVRR